MNISSEHIETLTAKLLDGTISDDEYRQIEHLVNSQPEFAQNLTEMTRIEDLLKSLHCIKPAVTPGLLESVENTVCTKINAGVAASSGAALAGKTLLGYAAGAVGIAVIAVVSYWATTSYRQSVPQPEAPRAVAERRQPAVETNPHILEDNSSTEIIGKNSKRPAETKISQNTVTEKQNLPESQSLPVQNALSATNNDAEIKAPANAERLLKDIKSYSELYVQAVAAGNQINAADNAKNLGLLYGKLNDAKQARLYFGRSAAAAQAAGIVESEAEAYGQWGIMEAKAGDIATAQECLGKAVRLLNEINVSSSKWQAQLDKLNAVK